ncbi:MAG: hypothetical protein Q4B81_01220 [Moraxella sp.]|nr:hypothetical protein [Moraxella sp.]
MSSCTLIISHSALPDAPKSRYFKHEIVCQNPFVYGRMHFVTNGGVLNDDFYDFLSKLAQDSKDEIYFVASELQYRQGEQDVAKAVFQAGFENAVKLTCHTKIVFDQLYII